MKKMQNLLLKFYQNCFSLADIDSQIFYLFNRFFFSDSFQKKLKIISQKINPKNVDTFSMKIFEKVPKALAKVFETILSL